MLVQCLDPSETKRHNMVSYLIYYHDFISGLISVFGYFIFIVNFKTMSYHNNLHHI